MQWVDIEFPKRIAMGAQRRPGWRTEVTQSQAGYEATNQEWSEARYSFDVSFAVRNATDYDTVEQHFHSMRGRAKMFPFRDPLDYTVTAARGVLLDDGDSPTTDYSLAKTYGTGAAIYYRRITRPKTGTITIYRNRGGSITDITGSSTISYTTGTVSFTGGTLQFGDVLSWTGQYFVPCRYDTDELPGVIVERNPGSAGELLVQCDGIMLVEVLEARL